MDNEPEKHGTRSPPPRGGQRSRALLVFTAAAFAVGLVLFTYWPSGTRASPDAVRVLRQAAVAAEAQPQLPDPTEDQYLYSRTQESTTSTYVVGPEGANFLFIATIDVESWTNSNDAGRVETKPKGVGFPTSEDETAWETAGRPDLESAATNARPTREPFIDIGDLPVEADALKEAIERREILQGEDTDLVTFQIIGRLLNLSHRSPEHRAALFTVASELGGVETGGSVTDPTGRPGASVSFDEGGLRHELILDLDSGSLIAERSSVLDPSAAGLVAPSESQPGTIIPSAAPAETVVLWRVYLDNGVVDSIDQRP